MLFVMIYAEKSRPTVPTTIVESENKAEAAEVELFSGEAVGNNFLVLLNDLTDPFS